MKAQIRLLFAPSQPLALSISPLFVNVLVASRSAPRLWQSATCKLYFKMPFSNSIDPPKEFGHTQISQKGSGSEDVAPDVIKFLESLKNFEKMGVPQGAGTDSAEGFDLGRMRRLLWRLRDPHCQYPVVHIAGTKGKGSTAAFISNILRAEGYSVGSYTSPHIKSIHERIISGKVMDPIASVCLQKLFQDTWKEIQDAIAAEQGSLTHFEVLTALAFKHFARENVDIAVIEAGLGGARDATNVISASKLAVAVITNVGMEHLAALGGSLRSIALAKSGIIKQKCPVVLGGPLDPDIEKVILEVAASKDAKVIPAFGQGLHYSVNSVNLKDDDALQCCDISIDRSFSFKTTSSWKMEKSSVQLRMIGHHQLNNAMTAICTILCLRDQGWRVQEGAIWSGLEHTAMPGRFQIVPKAEAIKFGCKNSTLVLDGAHSAGSAKALADTLMMVFPRDPLALVVAMASDKDHYAFSSELLLGARPKFVVVTETLVAESHFRSTSACSLADTWSQLAKEHNLKALDLQHLRKEGFGISSEAFGESQHLDKNQAWPEAVMAIMESKSILNAIKEADQWLHATHKTGVVCVTGSLHAVSAVLSFQHDQINV